MNKKEYQESKTKLNFIAMLLKHIDLQSFIDHISVAENTKPVFKIEAIKNIADAAMKLQDVCSKEYSKELERIGRRATE